MKNPHDWRFQFSMGEHKEPLFRLLGLLPDGPIEELPRELLVEPVVVDRLFRTGPPGAERLFHFEAISSWKAERIPTLALYLFVIKRKYELPLSSFLVFMVKRGAPKVLPPKLVYEDDDGFRVEAPYQAIRVWEKDPAMAFLPENKALLPWVPILNSTDADVERARDEVVWFYHHPERAPYPPDEMAIQFASCCVVRYDRDKYDEIVEGMAKSMLLSAEIFRDTWMYNDAFAEGRVKDAVRSLREALDAKFPGCDPIPEIDDIKDGEAFAGLVSKVINAPAFAEAREAILAAYRESLPRPS